jgi:hypothetical protein
MRWHWIFPLIAALAAPSFADETKDPSLKANLVNGSEYMRVLSNVLKEKGEVLFLPPFPKTYTTSARVRLALDPAPADPSPALLMSTPVAALDGTSEICRDLGYGCLIVDYSDPLAWAFYPKFEPATPLPPSNEVGNQIFGTEFLQGLLGERHCVGHVPWNEWKMYPMTFLGRIIKSPMECTRLLDRSGDLKPKKIQESAETAVSRIRALLALPSPDPREIEKTVLSHPLSFEPVASLYASLDESRKTLLEGALEKAVLLSAATFSSAADSRLPTYPHRNDDLVNRSTFLDWNSLYSKLKAMGRLPKIVSLTPELRARYGGIFAEQTSEWALPLTQAVREKLGGEFLAREPSACEAEAGMKGDWKIQDLTPEMRAKLGGDYLRKAAKRHWKRVALFNPSANTIFLDFTKGFYEAVYAFQHEIWHVFWDHTELARGYRERISSLLAGPRDCSTDLELKRLVYLMTVQNELGAINQSNLLYRFTGHLISQWKGSAPSAKAWYDSVFGGEEVRKLYIPRTAREEIAKLADKIDSLPESGLRGKTKAGIGALTVTVPGAALIATPLLSIWDRKRIPVLEARYQQMIADGQGVELPLLSQLLNEEFAYEIQFFEDRYFISLPEIGGLERPIDPSRAELLAPSPVRLGCEQAKRTLSLLPARWRNGLPFNAELVIPPGEACVLPIPGWSGGAGSHPGGAGSHPGGAGSHPGFTSIPCVHGREAGHAPGF